MYLFRLARDLLPEPTVGVFEPIEALEDLDDEDLVDVGVFDSAESLLPDILGDGTLIEDDDKTLGKFSFCFPSSSFFRLSVSRILLDLCTPVRGPVVGLPCSSSLRNLFGSGTPCLGVLVMGVFEPEGTRGVLLTPGVLVLEEATEVGVATSVGWVTEIAGVLGVELKMAAAEGVLGVTAWELLAAL